VGSGSGRTPMNMQTCDPHCERLPSGLARQSPIRRQSASRGWQVHVFKGQDGAASGTSHFATTESLAERLTHLQSPRPSSTSIVKDTVTPARRVRAPPTHAMIARLSSGT